MDGPLVGDILLQLKQIRNQGCNLKLMRAPYHEDTDVMDAAGVTATRAARRQPKQLRLYAAKCKRHETNSGQDEQVSR